MQLFETKGPEETYQFGKELGEKATPGQVYCLDGDLGTGKTVFAQGFAAGLGIDGPVNSPTFTILQVYENGRLPLYHFDVYRLEDVDEFYAIGGEEYFSSGICIIEWGELIEEALPKNCIRINFEKDLSDENIRYLTVTYPELLDLKIKEN